MEKHIPEVNNPKKSPMIAYQRQEVIQVSSPLPPPQILREYEEIVPGSAQTILLRVEKQANHRMEIERRIVEVETKLPIRGQIFALVLGLSSVSGALICAYLGQPAIGSVLGGVGLINVVAAFLRRNTKEENKK